jgi:uncharacterized oxidoreductase
MKTSGNTILITGAGTGIGLEAAKAFDREGNTLIMVARNEGRLKAEAAKLADAHPFTCDITDAEQVAALVNYVRQSHPDLNIVLLNAGVTNNYQLFGAEDSFEHAAQEMTTNYLSAVRLTQLFEPLLRDKAEAAFIITTSGVAFAPDTQNPTYSATKAALHSLVASQRFVLANKKSPIRVFELMPPLVDSPFSAKVKSDAKMPASEVAEGLLKSMEADQLEIRIGITEEIYQANRRSPEEAVQLVNSATGG